MNFVSVVDDVKARLARTRAEYPQIAEGGAENGQPPQPDLQIDLLDLDAIASRHYGRGYHAGQIDGFKDGHKAGDSYGARRQRSDDMRTLAAVADVLRERLERIPDRLSAPANGARDRRSKDELRQEAIDLVDEIRACFGVLLGGIVQGVFDEGS
jgi:hypothetical protein